MINNVTKLREIELELLKDFAKVCEDHGLKWYVFFGTLLGTVRNQGYLPWDDDIDVVMPKEDYRALCGHPEWFEKGHTLQTPLDDGGYYFAHLRKDGTCAFRKKLEDQLRDGGHMGISIDIIPLEEVPGADSYMTPTVMGCGKHDKSYPKAWFEPAEIGMFEGMQVPIPGRARKILTETYVDWAWPIGAEISQPNFWFFDTETDYRIYVNRYTGMLDDIAGKKIYLFGAADSLRIWLERFDLRDQVQCTFDNDSGKWGKRFFDVEVRNPAELPALLDADSRVIIVSVWHQEIGQQLEQMGIKDYYVYLDFYYDENVGNPVVRRDVGDRGWNY